MGSILFTPIQSWLYRLWFHYLVLDEVACHVIDQEPKGPGAQHKQLLCHLQVHKKLGHAYFTDTYKGLQGCCTTKDQYRIGVCMANSLASLFTYIMSWLTASAETVTTAEGLGNYQDAATPAWLACCLSCLLQAAFC